MYKLYTHLSKLILLSSLSATATYGWAGEDDFNQPIFIESKSNFFDGKTKTSVFRDDVLITQGSLSIKADEVEVIALAGDGKEIFIARGTPASYTQKLDDGEEISARANEIKYEVEGRILTLEGNAQLQQKGSKVETQSIVFNLAQEQLIAQGDESEESRVRTVFQPNALRKDNDQQEPPQKEKQQ